MEMMKMNMNSNKNNEFEMYKEIMGMWTKMMEMMNKENRDDKLYEKLIELERSHSDEKEKLMSELTKLQVATLYKELEELKQYAYRDPLEDIERQKDRLERLGLVSTNTGDKPEEVVALEKAADVLTKAVDKIDTAMDKLAQLVTPMMQAQADVLRQSVNAPTSLDRVSEISNMSEEEKVRKLRDILGRMEELEEGE